MLGSEGSGGTSREATVLVVNAGSSSLKVSLLPQRLRLTVERIGGASEVRGNVPTAETAPNEPDPDPQTHRGALELCLRRLEGVVPLHEIAAVGHRVVHGGELFSQPTLIDDAMLARLEELSALAPLHNPANIEGIRAARSALPGVPQIAVFDTAFHATLPPRAFLYGLPRSLYEQEGIRSYGFHGTSHDVVSRRAAELLGRAREKLKVVSLHLGNGASAAAIDGGRSIDTTMGFTPLAGLLMGTRPGDVDPGVLLHLLRNGMPVGELDRMLHRESGLAGLSGVSNDMRDVRRAAREGNAEAADALAVFGYRLRKTIGSFAAAMGGIDAVVFTGGIGENDPDTRSDATSGLAHLGIALAEERNRRNETRIGAEGMPVEVLVVPSDEEGAIADAARGLLRL